LPQFADLLSQDQVVMHTVIIGELATGNLPRRQHTLHLLMAMRRANEASFAESLMLIERERLHGIGIGWNDVQLLAAARLTTGCRIWTKDKPLRRAAKDLGVAADSVPGMQ
jgi:predicted nucleic acid-binding protein